MKTDKSQRKDVNDSEEIKAFKARSLRMAEAMVRNLNYHTTHEKNEPEIESTKNLKEISDFKKWSQQVAEGMVRNLNFHTTKHKK